METNSDKIQTCEVRIVPQKLNRKARIRDVAIVRNLGCYLSRETKKNILHTQPRVVLSRLRLGAS